MLKVSIMWAYLVLTIFSISSIAAAPPRTIPKYLYNEFTLDHQVPVVYWYFDDTYTEPLVYTTEMYNERISKALRKEPNYYGSTDIYLYQALDDIAQQIHGKEVALIGSATPWYESILLAYGARPIVIEYNSVYTSDPRVEYLTPAAYEQNPRKFEFILNISSTEHDGLGRYGDPINPKGDLQAMDKFKAMLKPGGKLLLAVPIGTDLLVWNAHRIYGEKRLKLLLKGWKQVKHYGFTKDDLYKNVNFPHHQPVFLLEPKP